MLLEWPLGAMESVVSSLDGMVRATEPPMNG